jgi:hypothetical protein
VRSQLPRGAPPKTAPGARRCVGVWSLDLVHEMPAALPSPYLLRLASQCEILAHRFVVVNG